MKFVPKGQINNKSSLFKVMAWCKIDDNPLYEPTVALSNDALMRHLASGFIHYPTGTFTGLLGPNHTFVSIFHDSTKVFKSLNVKMSNNKFN